MVEGGLVGRVQLVLLSPVSVTEFTAGGCLELTPTTVFMCDELRPVGVRSAAPGFRKIWATFLSPLLGTAKSILMISYYRSLFFFRKVTQIHQGIFRSCTKLKEEKKLYLVLLSKKSHYPFGIFCSQSSRQM